LLKSIETSNKQKKDSSKNQKNCSKRKKSVSKNSETKPSSIDHLKNQILDYLELQIKRDNSDKLNSQVYQERLTILQEFLLYLEEKNIITPNTVSNIDEVKKLVGGLMKIDLSKICDLNEPQNIDLLQKRSISSHMHKHKASMNSTGELKYSMIQKNYDCLDKENMPENNNTIRSNLPIKNSVYESNYYREVDYNSMVKRNLVVKKQKNDKTLKVANQKKPIIGHNRNFSTGSILQLKEIDGNDIINQKSQRKHAGLDRCILSKGKSQPS
jgi:hypothetical protein